MSSSSHSITGLIELNFLVQNLSPELNNQFHTVTSKYAQIMISEMNSIVPVRTGYLKSTIGSSSDTTSMQLYVSAEYAGYVNYGTSRQKAQPFFTGPLERHIPPMIEELNQTVASYIASNVST